MVGECNDDRLDFFLRSPKQGPVGILGSITSSADVVKVVYNYLIFLMLSF
jgi:hypothetical protein